MRSGMLTRSAGKETAQSFEKCAHAMACLFAAHHGFVRDPIDLDHASQSVDRLETVPGCGTVAEDQQCPFVRRDLGRIVVEVGRGTQDAKSAALALVLAVNVEQEGH